METALVTGASRGIGRIVAERLAAKGMRVLAGVRRLETAPRVAPSEGIVLDMASAGSIDACVANLTARGERIDVLVNNAGIYRARRPAVWDVNVRGPWLLTRGLGPLLAKGARVVMVTSGLAMDGADDALAKRLAKIDIGEFAALCDAAPGGYGASKAALNRMATLFAAQLTGRGVKVNAISPGWCRTEMGGAGAPRSAEQGADSILWGCLLDERGPSGGFFEDGRRIDA